jgi:hypothetical protein
MKLLSLVVVPLIILAAQATPIIVAALSLIGLIFAPLGAYLVARRQFSGQVETTDARALWEEARDIRKQAFARIAELNKVVERLEARNGALETRIDHLEAENDPPANCR